MDTDLLIGAGLLAVLFAAGFFIRKHVALILLSVIISGIAIYGAMQNQGGLTAVKGALYLLAPIGVIYAGRGVGSLLKRGKGAA